MGFDRVVERVTDLGKELRSTYFMFDLKQVFFFSYVK